MMIDDVDPRRSSARRRARRATPSTFVYEDAKRLATYTGKAHLVGPTGDSPAEQIELFLKQDSNELDRAEGDGERDGRSQGDRPHGDGRAPDLHCRARDLRHDRHAGGGARDRRRTTASSPFGAAADLPAGRRTRSTMEGNRVIRAAQKPIACPAGRAS